MNYDLVSPAVVPLSRAIAILSASERPDEDEGGSTGEIAREAVSGVCGNLADFVDGLERADAGANEPSFPDNDRARARIHPS